MLKLLTSFSTDAQRYIDGSSNYEVLMQTCRKAYKEFKFNIRKTAPNFIPAASPSHGHKHTRTHADNSSTSEAFYLDDMRRHIESFVLLMISSHAFFDVFL
jgi:hypothetical protein